MPWSIPRHWCLTLAVVIVSAATVSCSPARPDDTGPGTFAAHPLLDQVTWPGYLIPFDHESAWFLLGYRDSAQVDLTPSTRFAGGNLTSFDAFVAASFAGRAIQATVTGAQIEPRRVLAWNIAAEAAAVVAPVVSFDERMSVFGHGAIRPLLLADGPQHFVLTEWTEFDPAGDLQSLAAVLEAGEAGLRPRFIGEGVEIGPRKETLVRRVRVTR